MTSMIRWNPLKSLSGIDRFPDFDDLVRLARLYARIAVRFCASTRG